MSLTLDEISEAFAEVGKEKESLAKPTYSFEDLKRHLGLYGNGLPYDALFYLNQLEKDNEYLHRAAKAMFNDMVALNLPVPEEAARLFGKNGR